MYKPKIWQELTSDYQEIKPDRRLHSYVQAYWFSYSDQTSTPTRIIPDLCSDLVLQLTPDLEILSATICGPSTIFFNSTVKQPVFHFGIRYYLGGMYPFFNHSFKEMKNQLLSLDLLEKRMAKELIGKLTGKNSINELIQSADFYFLERLNQLDTKIISLPVQEFIESQYHGKNYSKSMADSSISQRNLQRLFREETGLSPYEVFEVLRFQKVYQEIVMKPKINHLDLVEKYHFFDQAHYSRKIKKMTGLTPQEIRWHVGIIQDKG